VPTFINACEIKINPYISIAYDKNGYPDLLQVANFGLNFAELTENRHVSDTKGLRVSMALKLELLVEYHAFHGF